MTSEYLHAQLWHRLNAVPYFFNLDAQALGIALMFFVDSEDNIVIQVPHKDAIRNVRRIIADVMGEPDRSSGTAMVYWRRFIVIKTTRADEDFRGYRKDQLFYVGFEDGSELSQYEIVQEEPS